MDKIPKILKMIINGKNAIAILLGISLIDKIDNIWQDTIGLIDDYFKSKNPQSGENVIYPNFEISNIVGNWNTRYYIPNIKKPGSYTISNSDVTVQFNIINSYVKNSNRYIDYSYNVNGEKVGSSTVMWKEIYTDGSQYQSSKFNLYSVIINTEYYYGVDGYSLSGISMHKTKLPSKSEPDPYIPTEQIIYNIYNDSYIITNNPNDLKVPIPNINTLPTGDYQGTPDQLIDDLVQTTPYPDIIVKPGNYSHKLYRIQMVQ